MVLFRLEPGRIMASALSPLVVVLRVKVVDEVLSTLSSPAARDKRFGSPEYFNGDYGSLAFAP